MHIQITAEGRGQCSSCDVFNLTRSMPGLKNRGLLALCWERHRDCTVACSGIATRDVVSGKRSALWSPTPWFKARRSTLRRKTPDLLSKLSYLRIFDKTIALSSIP
jgi:hypothetical protein